MIFETSSKELSLGHFTYKNNLTHRPQGFLEAPQRPWKHAPTPVQCAGTASASVRRPPGRSDRGGSSLDWTPSICSASATFEGAGWA